MDRSSHPFVEAFAAGWRAPHPHAWDALLREDIRFSWPMLRDGVGRDRLQAEFGRLLEFLPDLAGEVLAWGEHRDGVFIQVRLSAPAAGVSLEAVDYFVLRDDLAAERRTYFDPAPLMLAVGRRPALWSRAARLLAGRRR